MMNRNKLDISLLEFFRTGRFGPVALGMSRHEVLGLLGEPDAAGAGDLETRLCKYGDIEIGGSIRHALKDRYTRIPALKDRATKTFGQSRQERKEES